MDFKESQYIVNLPTPTLFKSIDFELILEEIVTDFISRNPNYKEVVLESDPIRKVFESWAYDRVNRNNEYNEDLKQSLLKTATGADLDNHAANLLIYRRVIVPADDKANPPTLAILEDDESLRFRAQTADRLGQTAGPKSAYERLAIEASEEIKEALVLLPTPVAGEVHIYLRGIHGDGQIDAETIEAVKTFISADDKRPLNDIVRVNSGKIIDANISLIVTYYGGYTKEEVNKNLTNQLLALNQFLSFGDPLTYNLIHATARVAGIQNIEIVTPTKDMNVDRYQYVEIRNVLIKEKEEQEEKS